MAVLISVSLKTLAEISEKSSGYSVTGSTGEITNIHYDRKPSGKRNRAYVWFDHNGRTEFCPSETIILIQD